MILFAYINCWITEESKQQNSPTKNGVVLSTEQKYQNDNQALSLHVESLQAQIQEQAKLSKEQVGKILAHSL
mgnify:FL=1